MDTSTLGTVCSTSSGKQNNSDVQCRESIISQTIDFIIVSKRVYVNDGYRVRNITKKGKNKKYKGNIAKSIPLWKKPKAPANLNLPSWHDDKNSIECWLGNLICGDEYAVDMFLLETNKSIQC